MQKFHRSMPILQVADVEAGIAFYTEKLGFSLGGKWGDDGAPACFAIVGRDGITLGLALTEGAAERADAHHWIAYLYVSDVDALAVELKGRSVKLEKDPEDTFYGCREIDLIDNAGHRICFGQDLNPGVEGPGL